MKIILLTGLVFSISATTPDPYRNFPLITNTNLGNAIEIHQLPNNNICAIYSPNANRECTIILFDPNGTKITQFSSNPYIFTSVDNGSHQIYWDTSTFVVPFTSQDSPFQGVLRRYTYTDLTLDKSFGDNGTTLFPDNINYIEFTSVSKNNNYYYAGGGVLSDDYSPIIARFNDDGSLDRNFNANGTPGYVIFNTLVGYIQQTVFLENAIILFLYSSISYSFYLVSISPENFSLLGDPIPLSYGNSNIEPYDSSSFFICIENTILKYTDRLELDTTFNQTGSLTFSKAPLLFPDSQNYFPLLTITVKLPYLFAAGNYGNANQTSFLPYIICYNIANMENPYLETSFFKTGYLLPTWSLNSLWGIEQCIIIPSIFPSLFIAGGEYIKYISPTEGKITTISAVLLAHFIPFLS